jgi:polyribonucleotide 5'-hydroxyl-kinase
MLQQFKMAKIDKMATQEFKLEPHFELRFEIEARNEDVQLMLKSGSAEIFGTELLEGNIYNFTRGANIAVFTWYGCVLELRGKPDIVYIAEEAKDSMIVHANCHALLDAMRQNAENCNTEGPVCMVVGSSNTGKSTFCRLLLNYAVRMGRTPHFVDLDYGQPEISLPGTIGKYQSSSCIVEKHLNSITAKTIVTNLL